MSGKAQIEEFIEAVSRSDLEIKLADEVVGDERAAFSVTCTFPDGRRVYEQVIVHLREGKVARQVDVEAWDQEAMGPPSKPSPSVRELGRSSEDQGTQSVIDFIPMIKDEASVRRNRRNRSGFRRETARGERFEPVGFLRPLGSLSELYPQALPGAVPHGRAYQVLPGDNGDARRLGRGAVSVDYDIAYGVQPDMTQHGWERDDWPVIYEKVKAADILVICSPIWLGEKSSVCNKVIERLYSTSTDLNALGQYSYYGRVGGCPITGNEDGVKHCSMNILYSLQHLQRRPKTLTPWQEASILGQVADRSGSQQNLYEQTIYACHCLLGQQL